MEGGYTIKEIIVKILSYLGFVIITGFAAVTMVVASLEGDRFLSISVVIIYGTLFAANTYLRK